MKTIGVVGNDSYSQWVTRILESDSGDFRVQQFASLNAVVPAAINGDLAAITIVVDDDDSADSLLRPFLQVPEFKHTRLVILTTSPEIGNVRWLANAGKLDYLCYAPDIVADAFLHNVHDQLNRYTRAVQADAADMPPRPRFFFDVDGTERELVAKLVANVDEVLGFQPRVLLPAGTKLLNEGTPTEDVTILLKGRVALERKSEAGEVLMHHNSTGRIIGLLSLTQGREAFFTARATTDVVGVHLTFEQFNLVLHERPLVQPLVAKLFIGVLDRRLRRSEDIQIEKVELTEQIEIEREKLAKALVNLEAAREEMTSQARFASLGELAAGVAHELNNPVAAIQRTAEHVGEDVRNLIASAPSRRWTRRTRQALDSAQQAHPVSTKKARRIRNQLTKVTKDPALSQRLVLAGLHDEEFAKEIARSRTTSFETVENAAAIGTALRNLATASERITNLVSSLRSYARPDGDPVIDVDVHDTLEDTIRLLSHRLQNIRIRRNYAEVPRIACHPGQLSQVWTNLINNAAEAMQDANPGQRIAGQITITTEVPGSYAGNDVPPEHIRIRIADDGPGIPEEVQQNMFEPHFTTKSGQVRFGMGIGLGVCRSIVQKHRGVMTLTTSPQGTTFSVLLPLAGPLAYSPTDRLIPSEPLPEGDITGYLKHEPSKDDEEIIVGEEL